MRTAPRSPISPVSLVETRLVTPPLPCIVPEGVFDAFGWCASDALDWVRPDDPGGWSPTAPIPLANPPRMVFVMRAPCNFLPSELACLHAPGFGFDDQRCLAPYAIDDATDELPAHRVRPGDLLFLATDTLAGLFWGLHDWAHFHNHGPFDERALTELQCDATALAWLFVNRDAIGLDAASWERARVDVLGHARARFEGERKRFDAAWLAAERIVALAGTRG